MDVFQHRPEMKLVCELPPGTTIKAWNGALIACHPDHMPIYIGTGQYTPIMASPEGHGGTFSQSGIVGW